MKKLLLDRSRDNPESGGCLPFFVLFMLAALLLATAVRAEPYAEYVLVPYAGALDELVEQDLLAGKVTPKVEWLRAKDGKLQTRFAKKFTDGGVTEYGEWQDADQAPALLTEFAFGDGVAKYDNDGRYYLRKDWYVKYKDRLIQNHDGRLEHFAKAKAKLDADPDDPGAWNTLVWDETDTCWRWPVTLQKMGGDGTLDGHKLKPPAAELKRGKIGLLLEERENRQREWRKKHPKN